MGEGSSQEETKKMMIKLKSWDEVEFEVEEVVAIQSQMLKNMIEDGCVENGIAIPIPNVSGSILSLVLTYCTNHAKSPPPPPPTIIPSEYVPNCIPALDLKRMDNELVNNIDIGVLFELMLAAHYLDINGLMDLTYQTVADTIKDMSPEEVREIFNIENDYTPEEEAKVRMENAWAFTKTPKVATVPKAQANDSSN